MIARLVADGAVSGIVEISWQPTHQVGVLFTSFDRLVERLGAPMYLASEDGRIRCEWILSVNGNMVTVYDWKEVVPVEQVSTWHVGGTNVDDYDAVLNLCGRKS